MDRLPDVMKTSAIDATTVLRRLKGVAALSTEESVAEYKVDDVVPTAVVQPLNFDELSDVLSACFDIGLAVAPYGGGTRVALGNTIRRLDCVLDLSRLDSVVTHNPADLTATVQAGATLSSLRSAFGEHGQFLPLDPPLPDRATIGGTLATAVSGPLKWQYGSPRDVVIGMSVVQANGKLTKSGGQVVKNVSGYDLPRLHIGGLGTLGVIGEVSLKLVPLPTRQVTLVATYQTAQEAITAAQQIFRSDVVPLSLVYFDGASNKKMAAIEIKSKGLLAIRLGGRPRTLERMVDECRTICMGQDVLRLEVLPESQHVDFWQKMADFGWDEHTISDIVCRAMITPSKVAELTNSLHFTESTNELQLSVISYPAHGTVLMCWNADETDTSTERVRGIIQSAKSMVHEAGGRMVVERCPTNAKMGIDVWDDPVESIEIMYRLKAQFDSENILNPGRFFGGI